MCLNVPYLFCAITDILLDLVPSTTLSYIICPSAQNVHFKNSYTRAHEHTHIQIRAFLTVMKELGIHLGNK